MCGSIETQTHVYAKYNPGFGKINNEHVQHLKRGLVLAKKYQPDRNTYRPLPTVQKICTRKEEVQTVLVITTARLISLLMVHPSKHNLKA
jgi:hypothetical protein